MLETLALPRTTTPSTRSATQLQHGMDDEGGREGRVEELANASRQEQPGK